MNLSWLKRTIPHVIAVAIFLIISIIYCKPALEGKVVSQHDQLGYKGMAQQSFEFREKNGHFPLWTESMFGGMPAYSIAMGSNSRISIGYVADLLTLGLPKPINFFFLACVCFYFLALVLRINPWIGILSALAYAYSSYDPIIITVGHETKMLAIGYAPAVIASLLLIYRRQYLWGAALLTLFSAMQMGTQHLQIIYYTLIGMALLTICLFIHSWREQREELKNIIIGIPLAAVCGAIAWGCFANSMLPMQEYAKESMRGGRTELTNNTTSKLESKGGLNVDYAFQWSYGIGETLTLVVPDIYGSGGMCKEIGDNSKFAGKFAEAGMPEDDGRQMANSYAYWGGQEQGTSGPVYLGAVICLLFILGSIYVKGWAKWWLLSFAILGILLSWGKHFAVFNDFIFEHLPIYNKFRAPTMALFMPQFAFPLLGASGLNEFIRTKEPWQTVWAKFKLTVIITVCLMTLLTGFYFLAEYKGSNDAAIRQNLESIMLRSAANGHQPAPEMQQQATSFSNALMKGLQQDRQSIYGADLLRTFLLIAASVLLMGVFLKNRINWQVLLGGLLLLSSFDLLAIGRRYLNEDSFQEPTDFEARFIPTPADLQIKKDPEKNFRVFDEEAAEGWFQDSRASYFFNSVGGYHPAKLGLYQDIMENQLMKGNMRVFNMLNTKYFIQKDPSSNQPVARLNPGAYGPCWLVRSILYVKDGNEEMKVLDSLNTRDTVVIQQKYADLVKSAPIPDSSATISLVGNLNDKIDYAFSARTDQFAVFSEIYYNRGWNAFIDGKKADYLRVDYVLRGMFIPAGEHTIEFRFEPQSYILGNTISVFASIIAYLLLIAALTGEWVKRKRLF